MDRHLMGDKGIRYILLIVSLFLLVFLLYYLRTILSPFCAAFLLAYILDPLVTGLETRLRRIFEKRKISRLSGHFCRVAATVIVFLFLCTVLIAGFTFFIPQVIKESSHFAEQVSKVLSDSNWTQRIHTYIPSNIADKIAGFLSQERIFSALQDADFWKGLNSALAGVLPKALRVLSGTASVVFWIVSFAFIAMYMIFLMIDMPKIEAKVRSIFPKKPLGSDGRESLDFLGKVNFLMKTYFRAQTLVALIVGILYSISFSIMGLPMGFLFGLFVGALNMVPYMQLASIPLAVILGIIYALDTGLPFVEVFLIIAAIYTVIQVLEDMVILPKIVGTELNLPPVAILLSISIWGKLLGFLGLVLAIPFTCIVLVILRDYKGYRILFAPMDPPEQGHMQESKGLDSVATPGK
jgi:predicted PurR-regulated permease PerM